MPWELVYSCELLSAACTGVMLVLFIATFFRDYTPDLITQVLVGLELLLILIIVFTPARICSYIVIPQLYIGVLICCSVRCATRYGRGQRFRYRHRCPER